MKLSELAAYAEEQYHIQEQFKWSEWPGFSVLTDPGTGKWAALLMRQWNYVTGSEIQRCDIKCGRQALNEFKASWLSLPFRMKGEKWIGVSMDEVTDPQVVCRLLDRALQAGQQGATIVLEEMKGLKGLRGDGIYRETPLPPAGQRPERKNARTSSSGQASQKMQAFSYGQALQSPYTSSVGQVPQKILEMMELYQYGDGSFENKCRNFYVQGRFMEDYEDECWWNGEVRRYFVTYHDLNLSQLRGYFTWRTCVRRGDYRRISTSLAYLYLYELLNGIGTRSAGETLAKMREFACCYLDSGIGDPSMYENLRRWMLEYAVVSGAAREDVLGYIDAGSLRRDEALVKLRKPQEVPDDDLFAALSFITGGKIEKSPIIVREGERGKHLLTEVWRNLTENYCVDGWDIFTACFGKMRACPWHPLANAVYYSEGGPAYREYVVNDCRKYVCRDGLWTEVKYDNLYFDRFKINTVVRAADRLLRRYLKTGHYLKDKKDEMWITPYVEAVIEADKAAIEEAAKPVVTLDLSGLDRIRRDAVLTRESLLTDEERAELPPPEKEEVFLSGSRGQRGQETMSSGMTKAAPDPQMQEITEENPPEAASVIPDRQMQEQEKASGRSDLSETEDLDSVHLRILTAVMRGESAADLIRENHLMPSVVTDAINEALFDEIGDNVLVCEGDAIIFVDDYREDVEDILGGDT